MSEKTKCIISLIIFIIALVGIIIVIVFDESTTNEYKTGEVTKSDSTLLEQTNYENKLKYQIDYLSQTNASFQLLLDRKENVAWAALALYLSGLVVFFFYELPKSKDINCWKSLIVSIILIIIAISAFAFIHAQYSSIYETYAWGYASNELLSRIIDSGEPLDNLGKEQSKHYNTGLTKGQKYRGQLHPFKILLEFICFDWTKSESGTRNLNSTNTQEASIYLIMLLFNAIIIVQIFKGGFSNT